MYPSPQVLFLILKISKVVSIYKIVDNTNFSNLTEPFQSCLFFLKSLAALCTVVWSTTPVNKHNILSYHQCGFRKKHSTFIAILELTNKIFESFENKEFTIVIFIDFKKAFDTVNHSLLLDKLTFFDIRGTPLNWMNSYLNSRLQYVQINNLKSQMLPIKCGVPQGSILGPLLFLIYKNDIFSCSKYLSFILFADDSNIFFQHKNICELIEIVNRELSLVASWFKPYKKKKKKNNLHIDNISISTEGNKIKRVECTKFFKVLSSTKTFLGSLL